MSLVQKQDESKTDSKKIRQLITDLAIQFYQMGWFPGSGGSVTIRPNETDLYFAPSGVQKERINPDDIFITDRDLRILEGPPPERGLKQSQCTPLFMVAYQGKNY